MSQQDPVEIAREIVRARERLASCAAELKTALEEAADLRSKLALVQTPRDGVWYWQGGGDHPESLACPVVMNADQARDFAALATWALALHERATEDEIVSVLFICRSTDATVHETARRILKTLGLPGGSPDE